MISLSDSVTTILLKPCCEEMDAIPREVIDFMNYYEIEAEHLSDENTARKVVTLFKSSSDIRAFGAAAKNVDSWIKCDLGDIKFLCDILAQHQALEATKANADDVVNWARLNPKKRGYLFDILAQPEGLRTVHATATDISNWVNGEHGRSNDSPKIGQALAHPEGLKALGVITTADLKTLVNAHIFDPLPLTQPKGLKALGAILDDVCAWFNNSYTVHAKESYYNDLSKILAQSESLEALEVTASHVNEWINMESRYVDNLCKVLAKYEILRTIGATAEDVSKWTLKDTMCTLPEKLEFLEANLTSFQSLQLETSSLRNFVSTHSLSTLAALVEKEIQAAPPSDLCAAFKPKSRWRGE